MSDMPLPTRWDREHYQQLINWLQGQADDGYRQFHQKILADADTPLLGVQMCIRDRPRTDAGGAAADGADPCVFDYGARWSYGR